MTPDDDEEPRHDLRYSTHYWTGMRSANPAPTCRKGGCGEPACEDSEYCEQHSAVVVAGQAWADGERKQLRGQGRLRSYSEPRQP